MIIRTALAAALLLALNSDPAGAASLNGVNHQLRAKIESILSSCPGSKVISALRNTRIRGSGRMSLHASGRAVDLAGNPSCIYAQLQGWPGGVSTDYSSVKHVHVSLGGMEHGLRFSHGLRSHDRHVRRISRSHHASHRRLYSMRNAHLQAKQNILDGWNGH